jgi:uncharacterized damage-inducible protein DinB
MAGGRKIDQGRPLAGLTPCATGEPKAENSMKTVLSCTSMIVLSATLTSAQTPTAADTGYTATLRSSWNSVKRFVATSAEKMPDANYGFKPTPEVRSFGELIGHLANEHYLLCSPLKGEKNPMADVDFEKKTAKADLVKAITDSIAYCDAAYAAMKDEPKTVAAFSETRKDTPFRVMLLNVTHDNEHYGNIITYLRMKGIVPPSSAPTR